MGNNLNKPSSATVENEPHAKATIPGQTNSNTNQTLDELWSKKDGELPRLVTAVVVGVGNRGQNYANFALDFPSRLNIVGVAEPEKHRREKIQRLHGIPDERALDDWSKLAILDKIADFAIITTQDNMHKDPAIAFANKGYHLLLEKPMAVEEEDCEEIADACERNNVMAAVGHVMSFLIPLCLGNLHREWEAEGALNNYGRHFVVGFTAQYSSYQALGYIGLSIRATEDTNVTIFNNKSGSPMNDTIFIRGGEILEKKLPVSLRMAGTKKQMNGIEIKSTRNISVVCLDHYSSSADGYLALPTNTLGLVYVAASYPPYTSYARSNLAIISAHDKNGVLIIPAKNVVINYHGLSYDKGLSLFVTLERLEALHLSCTSDMSGTIIIASKLVAVVSGVDRALPSGSKTSHDLLESFLLPVTQWGKQYILTTVGSLNKQQGDIFRIFAFENNTVVENAYKSEVLLTGAYTELKLGQNLTSFVKCNKPCQVMQYIRGEAIGGKYADPSMIVLPSENQFLSYYQAVLPNSRQYHDSITVMIQGIYKEGLYMNGIKLNGVQWKTIEGTQYVWTVVNTAGSNTVTIFHSSSAVKFGLLVYGFNSAVSYAYPGGFALSNIGQKQANQRAPKIVNFRDKVTNYGMEFVVGFTSLYRSKSGGQIGIAIVAHFDTNITIKTESVTKSLNVTFHMKEGEFLKYNLPLSLRMNGKQRNGVLVSSTENISVTCLDYRYSSYGGDGYLALPTYALGIIYVVASYKPYDYYSRAKIGIVAAHDRTNVLFKLNKNAVIAYNGISYNYGSPFHISLSKLQSVQLESVSDVSGSMIFASKPITVISSVDLKRPGSGNSDKLATLLLPVTQWGKQYILTTVGSMSHHKGDIFRVFAFENNTVVKNAYGSKLLSPGTYTELILDKNLTSFINCSKRCQVVQYIIGKTIGGRYADPSMIVLPSIKQFLPYYRVMASYASTYFSSVTITIEKRYTNGLYFDEVQMSNLTWLKVTGTNYVWTVVGMAGTKVATVYHSSPAVKFGLLVFGWYYSDSYAYPGGFGLHHFYTSGQEQANQMASKTATFTDKVTNYGMEFVVGFTSLYRSKSGGQIGIAIVAHFDTNYH
ncbi:uncharacterized protein LOC114532035 [Dendronephthya gigantea]|uniref:uncharacterized protein LOC114532035 n=1 Tax=Dendronephthya gigantea TaxID=151771 RepID=UPI00106CAED6|nr:uncharacterized protein LOC114532035 [Dendronephthya gigantea]